MNELTTQSIQLPDNLPDLAKFALIGREKLAAVRAEIRAIEKVGLAKEVHEQKLMEAQEIAEAVLDAEAKIGELTRQMETAGGGDRRSQNFKSNSGVTFEKSSKIDSLREAGFTGTNDAVKVMANRFESLASHPEAVEKAKERARAEGRVVTRNDALEQIKFAKQLEVIEEKGSDSLKQQVQDGDISINSAYQQIKRNELFSDLEDMKEVPRSKSLVREAIDDAKERHKDFTEQRKESVVSFQAAQQEKKDMEILIFDFTREVRRALNNISGISFFRKENDVKEIGRSMDVSERKKLTADISDGIGVLQRINTLLLQEE